MSSSHVPLKSQRPVAVSVLLYCLVGAVLGGWVPAAAAKEGPVVDLTRERVVGDVFHYSLLLKVGNTPHAWLRLHRVVREGLPGRPRPTRQAVMLLHGDFATFTSNFLPSGEGAAAPPGHGLAAYLAQQGIDVWGLDRRWTTAPLEAASLSDFAGMGFASAVEDIGNALRWARAFRVAQGEGAERFVLGGFSRGGHLAYAYAAQEARKPLGQRHLRGLVPIDIPAELAPGDEARRQEACARRDEERALLEAGFYDSDNTFFIQMGSLALTAPSAPSPLFEGYTNRDTLLTFVSQTFLFYAPTPDYHLSGGVLADGSTTALRYASEAVVAHWLASAPPHQALAELADGDALWCGEAPLPMPVRLGDIRVPLFYLGAAGGFGEQGLYSTTRVASSDVSSHIVRRLGAGHGAEDFGHADLLHAEDAPTLAWQPLAAWLLRH